MAKKVERKIIKQKIDIFPIILLVLMFGAAFYFSPLFPGEMKVHWNAKGEVDAYGSKFMGLFLMPSIALTIFICMLIIPKVAVFKQHVEKFKYYDSMKIALVSFFAIIYLGILLSNLGYAINMTDYIMPFVGLLLVYVGFIIKDVKRNYFIGIRTPWTLSSDKVWKKTHEVGSKTFILNGLVVGFSFMFKDYMVAVILFSVLLNVLFLFIYSYLVWKK